MMPLQNETAQRLKVKYDQVTSDKSTFNYNLKGFGIMDKETLSPGPYYHRVLG